MARKNIDLDNDVIRKLRVLAAIEGTNVKAYMQNVITKHVESKSKKLKL